MLLGRKAPKKAKAPTPTFRQLGTATRSLTAMTICESVRTATSSKVLALCRPVRRAAAPSTGTTTPPLLHLVDESSTSDEEAIQLKRRRLEVGGEIARGKGSIDNRW